MRTARSVLLSALLLAVASLQAQAHHEVGGYDMSHPMMMEGLVREFVWANPHVVLYLQVNTGSGKRDDWTLEGGSVQALAHRGWSRTSLRPGDTVEVLVAPVLGGQHAGRILRVIGSDGRVLSTAF